MAAHSSILAWEIPWTEEPGRLQSMQLPRVGHDLVTQERQKCQITSQPAHSLSLVYDYCPPFFLKPLPSPPMYLHFPLVTLPKISRTKLEQHEEGFCRLPPAHLPVLGCAHCYSTLFHCFSPLQSLNIAELQDPVFGTSYLHYFDDLIHPLCFKNYQQAGS